MLNYQANFAFKVT